MQAKAINKARNALTRADTALRRMVESTTVEEMEEPWEDFLQHVDQMVNKLKAGSRVGSSKGWFDKIERDRRTDQLLQYVHQARNVGHHCLQDLIGRSYGYRATGGAVSMSGIIENGVENVMYTPLNPGAKIHVTRRVILVDVTDERSKTTFVPPVEHMGQEIADPSPAGIARLALQYYSMKLEEADAMVVFPRSAP